MVPPVSSCDTTCIINGTILFIRCRQPRHSDPTLSYVMLLAPVWASHDMDVIVSCTILLARSIAPLQLLVQDDQKSIWHPNEITFSHLLALASVSWDATATVNSTTAFIMKWGAITFLVMLHHQHWHQWCITQLFWSYDMRLMILSFAPLHSLYIDDKTEMQHDFSSCDAVDARNRVTWCQWHHQWNHCIPLVEIIKVGCKNMTFQSCNTTGTT